MKIISKGHFKSIKQFHIFEEKKLGSGSFGVVKLAIHAATNKYYAIKIISLKDIPSEHEMKLIERQIKLHSEISHPHVTSLWDTMIDQKNLYMVLEYAERGNLFYYQNTKNKLSEPQAFIYFTQTVKAIQNLHLNNVMHRDIKPQNLLIDQFWNIKLCDFGWAAEDIHTKRTTFCGTYEYMAPEMVFSSHYDFRVDIWALGVLLYEMIHGCSPFKGNTVNQVKEKMLKTSFNLSQKITETLKNLIVSLLKFDPNERLSIKEILNHPWIQRMEVLVSTYLISQKLYDPLLVHKFICEMPQELYELIEPSNIYSHNVDSEDAERKKFIPNLSSNTLKKVDRSDLMEKEPKNINISLSINNFSYLKDGGSQTKKYLSPESFDLRQKKSVKRYKTQINADNMSSVLSPSKAGISRSKETTKREQKKTPTKNHLKTIKTPKKGEPKPQKSGHKPTFQTQDWIHPSAMMQKIAMNLRKHTIKQKSVSNYHQYSPRNIRQLKKIKSKDKSCFNDFSHM